MKPRVLVTETMAQEGLDLIEQACAVNVVLNPEPDALAAMIGNYEGLVIRSRTKVTAALLAGATNLRVIGRPGTGVDNVDLEAATRHGIVVVNAPTSTTVAVAEHTLGLMLAMARNICQASVSMRQQRWEKGGLVGTELYRKTLGIVGLGRIGAAVAQRARAFEMCLLAYDPFVSQARAEAMCVKLVSLDELLSTSDYVTLHTPLNDRTRGIIGERELALMRPEARLVNCARGGLVDEQALVASLSNGRLAGAALDVLSSEPEIPAELAACPNLLLTPHLGASTEEAQSLAAVTVAEQLIDVLEGRSARYSVNVPVVDLGEAQHLASYLDLAQRLGRLCGQSVHDGLMRLEVICAGETTALSAESVTSAALAGLLSEAADVPVNTVNAHLLADERGIKRTTIQTDEAHGFPGLVTLVVHTADRTWRVSGSVLRGHPRVLQVDRFWFDFAAEGRVLFTEHIEQPGVIGQMGTLLGEMGQSISFVQVGRQERGGPGLMVLGLDDDAPADMLGRVKELPSVRGAWLVRL